MLWLDLLGSWLYRLQLLVRSRRRAKVLQSTTPTLEIAHYSTTAPQAYPRCSCEALRTVLRPVWGGFGLLAGLNKLFFSVAIMVLDVPQEAAMTDDRTTFYCAFFFC